ncbi:chorismate mutase aro7 [Entomophthora muscae]|uniref:Chorismate mutase aro7 n=1 Tax=Entomophthora muscae TaxID=34485 RepID=A0ACC2S6T7_9FUNG|nr:chorismate mutase aro7 [Entomophthora muscae]
MDLLVNTDVLPLGELRKTLIRLEDTITFAFIERAQFKLNKKIYTPGEIHLPDGEHKSFLEYFLHEVEAVHAKVRRYTSPDEYPFTDDLPKPVLPPLEWPIFLKSNNINLNKKIFQTYITEIAPKICSEGDDMNYGTAATLDIEVLQALSRRIHYG